MRRRAAVYNAIPNFLWTIIHLAPSMIYCWNYTAPQGIYIGLGGSFLFALLPAGLLKRLQLSSDTAVYKKIGVGIIRKYSQDGDLINRLLRKQYPAYRVIEGERAMPAYISKTYMAERFHLMMLVFMGFISVWALLEQRWGWALLIMVNNVLYNLYPMFLQQYNRIRLIQAMKRRQ
jgi:hypothetical protein